MKKAKWLLGAAFVAILIGLIYLINALHHSKPEHVYRVGVFQVVRHPVLDAMAKSFEDSLEARYPGKVLFDMKVPEGDAGKTEQMAQSFASGDCDLVFVIGTNLAQSLAKKTKTIPIVLGGATDPQAAGLVDSWEKPGRNVTGTSDLSPVALQLSRLRELLPQAKRVGIIYNPSEDNSKVILAHFERQCEHGGLTPVSVTISSPNDIQQTLVSLVGKIDALYAPTDATVQSAFPALIRIANEVKIPVLNCDEGTARKGALFSVGFNYEDLGRTSADMAASILDGRSKPQDMPIRLVGKSTLYYNAGRIQALGLSLPKSWTETGVKVDE
jgi:putative ABC transport system substrate-binding protein